MRTDPNLDVELDDDVVEVGGTVTGRIQRWPSDGDDNSKKIGKVQAVRVKVSWRTEGRGDRTDDTVGETTISVTSFGQANGSFSIPIPPDAPISYDGSLIRVIWELEARTDRKLAIDPKNAIPLLVVPSNGKGRYRRPHPLPKPDNSSPSDQFYEPTSNSDDPFADRDSRQPEDSAPLPTDPFADRPDYLDNPTSDD